jgi:putative transposase
MKIKEIAAVRIRYGYRRIHVLLKREGWQINAKRVYRLYNLEGLNLRNKSKCKTISQARVPNPAAATKKNECWAMDFV